MASLHLHLRKKCIACILVLTALVLAFQLSAQQRDIVLILTDDQAWHTARYMHNVNALIGDAGVRFDNAFTSTSLCCPSRVTHLTGQYSHNHGVRGNGLGWISNFNDASSVATWLSDAGYRTALFGKYLNGYERMGTYVPPGWSRWFAFTEPDYYGFEVVDDGHFVTYDNSFYSTTVLADEAVAFIESTPPEKPLFLYFAPFAPHWPSVAEGPDVGTFDTVPPWRPPNFNEADVSDKPLWIRELELANPGGQYSVMKKHLASLQSVDRAVARIVEALTNSDRIANAVLIFSSDNGYAFGEHRIPKKMCVHEACIRNPIMIRAPGVLPRTENRIISNIDIAPSIAEWAGVQAPAGTNGRSLVPLLADPLHTIPWRGAVLLEQRAYWSKRQYYGIRTADGWKYVEYNNKDKELYDLINDPWELLNRAGDPSYAEVKSALRSRLQQLKAQ